MGTDSAAKPIGKIHPRQLKQLEKMGVIEPGEKVLYFYSAALLSIRREGNLFTDRRVISYQEYDGKLELNDGTYDAISTIDFEPSDDWLGDSTITITLDDGSWFVLYVSKESNGDTAFYEKLTETWKRKRAGRRAKSVISTGTTQHRFAHLSRIAVGFDLLNPPMPSESCKSSSP